MREPVDARGEGAAGLADSCTCAVVVITCSAAASTIARRVVSSNTGPTSEFSVIFTSAAPRSCIRSTARRAAAGFATTTEAVSGAHAERLG
nr:hypothetical protein GCM10025699_62080 [Microbacterium flavescens]